MNLFEFAQARRHEVGFEKEILRRVTREDEFGRENNRRAAFFQSAAGVDDLAGVSSEISDGWVELCEADVHLPKPPLARGHDVESKTKIRQGMGHHASREATGFHRHKVVGQPAEKRRRPIGHAVHKHEKRLHQGMTPTKLKKGGPTSEDRMRQGRNMSRATNQGSK